MEDSRLIKKVYLWDRSCLVNNWNRDLKRLFKEIDKEFLWNVDARMVDMKDLLEHAEKSLMHTVKEQWKKDLNSQSKLRTYKLFKENYNVENYVEINLPRNLRSGLARLRSGTLPIRVKTGRFEQLPINERLCKICNQNMVEDEYHFVFECVAYDVLRIMFLNHVTKLYPDFMHLNKESKWRTILTDKRLIPQMSHFIINALEKRSNMLYRNVSAAS